MASEHDAGVVYTVKELIGMLERTLTDQIDGINRKLDDIGRRLSEKSSNHRVDQVEQRIGHAEKRIGDLELFVAGNLAVSKAMKFAVGTVGVGLLGSIATLVWLAAGGH